MKTVLPGAHLRPQTRWQLPGYVPVLIGIIGLLAFYPLTGCSSIINGTNAHTGPTSVTTTTTATATATATATTTATRPTSPWKLTWSDEFDGPAGTPPDPSKWTSVIGIAGGNGQLDYDTNNKNAYQDGQGNLVIEARKENPARYQCLYGSCKYTSAQITTEGHFSFTYGRLEARIKIPDGQGIWPSFWLLDGSCKVVATCGEIDIMEIIGRQPDLLYGTVHGPGYFSGIYKLPHGIFADDYHVFELQWDPNHIYFFMDGINYATLNRSYFANQQDWIYDHPLYIILNVAVGGTWPGNPNSATIFPRKMYVSYVRYYTHT